MRRSAKVWALALTMLGAIGAQSVSAWGPPGHETIGAIADTLLIGTQAEREIKAILGEEKLATAALWADCVKGVGDRPPYRYHMNSRYPECDPFQQTASGREAMEDYVRRNAIACHPRATEEACHKAYHYTDVAIEHDGYDRADVGTSEHDLISAIEAAVAKLKGQAVPPLLELCDQARGAARCRSSGGRCAPAPACGSDLPGCGRKGGEPGRRQL